jgi:PAS domain S-box-containing protein
MTEGKYSILVVENDAGVRRVLSGIFHKKGHSVTAAGTGSEAIDRAKQTTFDVALIDVKLPDMDGASLFRRFKREYPDMVCAILTGREPVQNVEDTAIDAVEAVDRQRLQRRLRRREETLRSILALSPIAIVVTDLDGNILECNQAAADMYRFSSRDRLNGKNTLILIAKRDRERMMNVLKMCLESGSIKNAECTLLTGDGVEFPAELSASVIKDSSGNTVGFVIMAADITKYKHVEDALNFERQQLLSVFDSIDEPIYVSDPNTREVLYANKAMKENFGYVNGQKCHKAIHGLESPCPFCMNEHIFGKDAGLPYIREYQNRVDARWYRCTGRTIRWHDGRMVRCEIAIDVTERKKAEEEIRRLNEEFERKVIERTARLEADNKELQNEIRERMRIEAELHEEKEKFRNLIENAPIGISISTPSTPQGTVTEANPALWKIFGYDSKEEYLKVPASDHYFDPKDRERLVELRKKDTVRNFEVRFRRKDGSVFWGSVNSLEDVTAGGTTLFISTLEDITERKKMEETLWGSQERYRSLVENTVLGITVLDTNYRISMVNPTLAKLFKRPASDFVGKYCFREFEKREAVCPHCPGARAMVSGKTEEVETCGVRDDGGHIYVRNRATPLFGSDGVIKGFIEIIEDIGERKKAEEALRASGTKYKTLVESIPQKIFLKDRNSVYISCNENYARDLKIKPEEIAGKTDYEFHPKELAEKYRGDDRQVMDTGKTEDIEEGYIQDGQERFVHTIKTPVRDENGRVVGILGIFWDITERKQMEEEIRRNYDTQILTNTILSLSLEDVPLEEILKRTTDMILSVPWLSFESRGSVFLVEDDPKVLVMKASNKLAEQIQKSCARVPFGRCHCGRAALTQKMQFSDKLDERHETTYDGIYPHGHYCVPIVSGGKTLGVLNIYTKEGHRRTKTEVSFLSAMADVLAGVIERKRAEEKLRESGEQLRQAQKMAAVGQLAGGVAHEINNPLTGVLAYSARLLKKAENPELMKIKAFEVFPENLEIIKESAIRCEKIVKGLLAFARQSKFDMASVDVNETIKSTLLLAEPELRVQKIRTVLSLQSDLPSIKGNPFALQQVFANIVLNARDAMPDGGALAIGTKASNGHVEISLSDTGIGISQEDMSKLFTPFFTTKPPNKGTGLGLSVAYGIVKDHSGDIRVESKVGKGTTFRVLLPVEQKSGT